MSLTTLLEKYDVPVPRYTSYPTAPQWKDVPPLDEWTRSLAGALAPAGAALSLYVHLPFCETLCTFCGCNTVITRNRDKADAYVTVVLAELDRYLALVPLVAGRALTQVHLGGGTPTFLPPATLRRLLEGLRARLPRWQDDVEGSVEVDPRVTTEEQLDTLRRHGFSRVSFGVQDIDEHVMRLVNREQPMSLTSNLCRIARRLGYDSINCDLIYGLPGQTPQGMQRLAAEIIALAPDRLALYSFARVPWIKPAQRKFTDEQVPAGAAKRDLYETMRTPLVGAGYVEIGMDHFALPHDGLARAAAAGTLHRNFMGYTNVRSAALLGLGVSAISETPGWYHQNEKVLTVYERLVAERGIPTLRGHRLSDDDRRRAAKIQSLMTRFRAPLDPGEPEAAGGELRALVEDGLIDIDAHEIRILPAGRPFLRNAAAFFDAYLRAESADTPKYSRAI